MSDKALEVLLSSQLGFGCVEVVVSPFESVAAPFAPVSDAVEIDSRDDIGAAVVEISVGSVVFDGADSFGF